MMIETERLILREWKLSDISSMVEGLNNFDTSKNLTVPFPYTKEHAESFINKHLKNDENNYYFAIVLKDTNKVIGGTSLEIKTDINKNKGGIWLNNKYHGKGLGTEVWIARAKFAFETLNLNELENGFFEHNEISWKMQQKLGYKIVGKTINYCPALNREVVEIITNLKKEEFYNSINN
ncbi:MAG: GNAT family N-acetyltransferase [Clostridiales bacterium]|nr:GNAT family N-acetyltransferase [Clostridiales bacterium]